MRRPPPPFFGLCPKENVFSQLMSSLCQSVTSRCIDDQCKRCWRIWQENMQPNFKSVLPHNLYISTVFRSVSWLIRIMRAAHFLKHYVCKGKSLQRELHFLWRLASVQFSHFVQIRRKWGKSTQHKCIIHVNGSASYDLTMLHIIITTRVYNKRYTNNWEQ